MNLKLEYIILIILALMFYFYSLKDDLEHKKNKKFVKNNLKIGSRIITESKIIGEVLEINKNECLIITGTEEKNSYLLIKLNSIESIIEA
ncbi:preprotein translocase subunit YajC [Anaerococcus senegalensis]|uniref:preprotein translocase subunit YajC n=1 Tax=Anaerococcus senegalensis TaxID=1288120 RepID=UPI00031E53F7|nr:preprotein translocase subunit YajC [Anaerococcus senegalensis]